MFTALFRGARRRARRASPVGARRPFAPRLEVLEDRSLPSTLTVTNPLDSGPGSLRDILGAAQNGDRIDFAPNLSGQTLTLGNYLTVARSVAILGPGANPLTID